MAVAGYFIVFQCPDVSLQGFRFQALRCSILGSFEGFARRRPVRSSCNSPPCYRLWRVLESKSEERQCAVAMFELLLLLAPSKVYACRRTVRLGSTPLRARH